MWVVGWVTWQSNWRPCHDWRTSDHCSSHHKVQLSWPSRRRNTSYAASNTRFLITSSSRCAAAASICVVVVFVVVACHHHTSPVWNVGQDLRWMEPWQVWAKSQRVASCGREWQAAPACRLTGPDINMPRRLVRCAELQILIHWNSVKGREEGEESMQCSKKKGMWYGLVCIRTSCLLAVLV